MISLSLLDPYLCLIGFCFVKMGRKCEVDEKKKEGKYMRTLDTFPFFLKSRSNKRNKCGDFPGEKQQEKNLL